MPGDGISSHPKGGSDESPGTGAQTGAGGGAQTSNAPAHLDSLAQDVQARGNDTDRLIMCLPEIAAAMAEKTSNERNKQGWLYLVSFFNRWLAGPGNADPFKGGEPAKVDWSWLEEFDRVKDGIDDIKGKLFSEKAEKLLLDRLKRDGLLKGERCAFNYIQPARLLDGVYKPEWERWKESYFQSAEIKRQQYPDFEDDGSVADGLQAAMASFMIYALAKGYTDPIANGHKIVIEEVALLAWDSFNFDGTDYYGSWRCTPPDFLVGWDAGYTILSNGPFDHFRNEFGHGNDFLVLSGPHPIELKEDHIYYVSE